MKAKQIYLLIALLFTPSLCFAWGSSMMVQTVASGGSLFSDNFDSSTDPEDNWDGIVDGNSNLSIDSVVYNGASGKSLKFESDSSTQAKIYKDLGSAYTDLYFNFYVRFDVVSGLGASGNFATLYAEDSNGGQQQLTLFFRTDASGNIATMRIRYYKDTGLELSDQTISPAIDTWYQIKIRWKPSTGEGNDDGVLQSWFGGTAKHNITDIDSDTRLGVRRYLLGLTEGQDWAVDQSQIVRWDGFEVAESDIW